MRISKRAIIAGLLSLCVIGGAGGVLAYLTSAEKADNRLTAGENKITIVENYVPPELERDMTYKKEVRVKNIGDTDAYVRVRVMFSNVDAKDRSLISTTNDTGPWFTTNWVQVPGEFFGPEYNTQFFQPFHNYLPENWAYHSDDDVTENGMISDGYYYYTKPVKPNEFTDYLFRYLRTIYPQDTEPFPYDITVYAESVQTLDKDGKEFDNSDGDAYLQAWKEFLERKTTEESSQESPEGNG